jgi:hypothetical protein
VENEQPSTDVHTTINRRAHNHQQTGTQPSTNVHTNTNKRAHKHQQTCTQTPTNVHTHTNKRAHKHQQMCTLNKYRAINRIACFLCLSSLPTYGRLFARMKPFSLQKHTAFSGLSWTSKYNYVRFYFPSISHGSITLCSSLVFLAASSTRLHNELSI